MKNFLLIIVLLTMLVEARGAKSKFISKGVKTVSKATKSLFNKKTKLNTKKIISASKMDKKKAKIKIRKTVPKITGIYKFKASNGKPYIGKSTKTKNQNIQKRLTQHINSGKLHPKDINTISFAKIDKKDVSKVEKQRIMKGDISSRGNLANNHHAPWSRNKSKEIEKTKKDIEELKKELLKTKF